MMVPIPSPPPPIGIPMPPPKPPPPLAVVLDIVAAAKIIPAHRISSSSARSFLRFSHAIVARAPTEVHI